MSEIDWSKAPLDAQGFMPGDHLWIAGWWKQEAGSFYWWSYELGENGGWKKTYAKPFDSPKFQRRPSSPAWSGDGLPPVGLVLEYMWNYKPEGSEYVQVEILVHDKGSAIMRALDGPDPGVLRESRGGSCGQGRGQPIFRPIRTPEQIAAAEREAAIQKMMRIIPLVASEHEICGAFYDAGLRFVDSEQPK